MRTKKIANLHLWLTHGNSDLVLKLAFFLAVVSNVSACKTVCRHRTEIPFDYTYPFMSPSAYISPNATVVGNVELGDKCFVWNGAVIRGDENGQWAPRWF
jgi:hypothetical protein